MTVNETSEALRGAMRMLDEMMRQAPDLHARATRLVADLDAGTRPYVDFVEDLTVFMAEWQAFGDTLAAKYSFDAPGHPFGRPPDARA